MQNLRSCRAEVLLLTSSEEVRRACESVCDTGLDFALKLSDGQHMRRVDLDCWVKQLACVRDHFLEVARKELGIRG